MKGKTESGNDELSEQKHKEYRTRLLIACTMHDDLWPCVDEAAERCAADGHPTAEMQVNEAEELAVHIRQISRKEDER